MAVELPKPDLGTTSAEKLANLVQAGQIELSEIPFVNRGDVEFVLKMRTKVEATQV